MAVAQVLLLAAVLLHCSSAVPACPESCTCQNPDLLNCSSSGLTLVPQHIPESVTELDLSDNLLYSVTIGRRQSHLRNVWLGNNRITRLALCLERSLGGRYVTGRRLHHLRPWQKRRCVPWAPTLQLLSVERNQLEQLPEGLPSCESLQVLQLSFNRISTLRPQDFDNLRKLKELNLKHNLITSLHPQTFKGLAQLQVLDLSFNMLTSLHPSMYLSLHNIGANVKLAGNRWKCDCSMRSLRRRMGYDGSRGLHAWSVVCASPSKLSGRDLLHLEEDDLNCFTTENRPERHQSVTVFSGSEILLSCSAQDSMGWTPSGQASVNQPEAGLLIKDITERDTGLYVCVSEEQGDVSVFNLQISKVGGAQRKARSLPGSSGQTISQGIPNRIGNERNQRATSSQLALAVCLSILFTFLVAFILGVLARPCIDVLCKRVCKKKSSTATNTMSTVEQSQYDNEAYSEIEEREVRGTHRERRVTFSTEEDSNVQYYDTVANGDQESINDVVFEYEAVDAMKDRARDSESENSSQRSPEDNQRDSRNLSGATGAGVTITERRHSSSSDSSRSDREYNEKQSTQQDQTRPKSPQLVQDSVQQRANISTAGEVKVSHISIESTHEETGFSSEPFEGWSPHPDHTNRTDPDNWQENEEQFEFSDSARSTSSRSNSVLGSFPDSKLTVTPALGIQKRNDTSSSSSYLSEDETTQYTVNSDQEEDVTTACLKQNTSLEQHIHVMDANRPSVGINHGQPGLGKAHSFSSSSSESEGEDRKTIQETDKGVGNVESVSLSDKRSSSAVTGELVKVKPIPHTRTHTPSVGVAPSPAAAYSSSSSSESEEENKDLQVKHKHGESQMTKLQFQEPQTAGNALETQTPLCQDKESRWPVLNLGHTTRIKRLLDFKAKSADTDSSSSSDSEDEKAIYSEKPGKVVISDLAIQKPQTESHVPDTSWPSLDLRHIPKVKRRLDIKAPSPASSSSNSEDESTNHIKKQWQQQRETARVPITTSQNVSHGQGTQWPIKAPSPASDSSSSSDSEDESTKHVKKQEQQTNMAKLPIKGSQTALLDPHTQWPLLDLEHTTHIKKRLDFKAKSPASDTSSSDSEDETTKYIERPGKVVLPELAIQKPQTDRGVPDTSWPSLDLRHIPKVKRRLDIKAPSPASDSSSSSESEDESTYHIKKQVQQPTEMAEYPITITQTVIHGQGTQWPVKAPSPASDSSSSSESEDESTKHMKKQEQQTNIAKLPIKGSQTALLDPHTQWPLLDLEHTTHIKKRLDFKAKSPASDTSSSDSEDETTKYIERPGKVVLPELAIQKSQTDSHVPDKRWPSLDLSHIPKIKRRLDVKAPSLASDSSSSSESEDESTNHIEKPGKVVLPELAIQKPQTDSRVPDTSWPSLDLKHIPKIKRRLDIKAPTPASDSSSSSDSENESTNQTKEKVQQQTDMERLQITLSQNVSPDQGTRWPVKAPSTASDSSSSSDNEDEQAIHRERPGKVVISDLAIQKPQTDIHVPDTRWPSLDLRHIPKVKRRLDIKAKTPASDSSSSSDSENESTNQTKKKVQQQTEVARVPIPNSQNVSQDQGTLWPVKAPSPASDSSSSSDSEDESTKHLKKQDQLTDMGRLPIKESQTVSHDPQTQWPLLDLQQTTRLKRRLDFKAKSADSDTSSSDSENDTNQSTKGQGKVVVSELVFQKSPTVTHVQETQWPVLDLKHSTRIKRRLDIKVNSPDSDTSSSSDSEEETTTHVKTQGQGQLNMTSLPLKQSHNVVHDQQTRWPVLDLEHTTRIKRRLDIKAPSPHSDSSSSSDSEDETSNHLKKPGVHLSKSRTVEPNPILRWPELGPSALHVKSGLDQPESSSSSDESEVETTGLHLKEVGVKHQTGTKLPDLNMSVPLFKPHLNVKAPSQPEDSVSSSSRKSESNSSTSESEDENSVLTKLGLGATAISKTTEKDLIESPQSPVIKIPFSPKVDHDIKLEKYEVITDHLDEKTSGNISTMPVINPELESRWATMSLGVSRFRKRLDITSRAHGPSKMPSSPQPVSPASSSSSESGDEGQSSRTLQKRRGNGMQGKIHTESSSKAEITPVTASLSLKSQDRSSGTAEFKERKERPSQSQTSSSSDSENDKVDHSVPDLSLGVPRVKRRLNVKATFPEPRKSLSSSSSTEVTGYTTTHSRQVFNMPQYRDTDTLITYKRSIFQATSPPSSPPPLSDQTMYDTKQRYSENAQKFPSYTVGDRSTSVASKRSLSRSFDDLLNKMVGNSKRTTELPPELRWTGVGRQMPDLSISSPERRLDVGISSPPAEPKLPPPDSSSSESDDEIKQDRGKPDITEHKYSSLSAGTVSSASTRTFDTVDNSSISTNEIVWGVSEDNRQRKGLSALKAISSERQKWDITRENSENSASSLFDDYDPHTQVHLSSTSVDDRGATDWLYGIPSYRRHGIGNNEPPQETPPPIPATPPPSDEALGLTWRSRPNSWKERTDGTRYYLPQSRNTGETDSSSLASQNLEVLLDLSNNPITKV